MLLLRGRAHTANTGKCYVHFTISVEVASLKGLLYTCLLIMVCHLEVGRLIDI